MKGYLKKYGVKLLVLVLVVALVVGFVTVSRDGEAGTVENAVADVRNPFQKVAAALVSRVEELYGYMYRYDMLMQENENLRAENADLQKQLRENEQAKEENEELRELLNLRQKHEDFVFESAKVVSWNASNWASTFTISKGSESGIEVGDSVVTAYGVLVGTVIEVGNKWATVETIVDINTSIGALVGAEEVSAMLLGDYTLMSSQHSKLSFVAETGQVITGDLVLTSGAGGKYPQGLILGTVSSVHTEAAGQIEYAVVEPYTNLNGLTQVFVIKEYTVVE